MHYLDYNEKRMHGTPDFPMELYQIDNRHPRYEMPFHWHVEAELIRVLQGTLSLSLDGEDLPVGIGEIAYIAGGVIHGGIPQNCRYECVVFHPQILLSHGDVCRQELHFLTGDDIAIRRHFTREDRSFFSAAQRLFRALRKKTPGGELRALGALYELYGVISQNRLYQVCGSSCVRDPKKTSLLKAVLEYIRLHYAEAISLKELSHIAGMSPKYFCRYFQALTHRSPIDYLNYYRVERACCLLENAALSVTEVAYECGFNDTSYFIRTFKKYKDITPKQYSLQLT